MPALTLRLSEEEHAALKRLADQECRTLNSMIRKLLRDKANVTGASRLSAPTRRLNGATPPPF